MGNHTLESAPGPASQHDTQGAEHSGNNIPTVLDKEYTFSSSSTIELIRSFSGQTNTITFSKLFLAIAGDIPSALMLGQLVFWWGKGSAEGGWIWKRDQDWEDEVGISPKQALRARNNLKRQGLIETKIKKAFGNPTLHYRVCERKLLESLVSYQRYETNHPKGTKRNIPKGRNETYQRDETITDLYNSPNTDTHTRIKSVCGDPDFFSPTADEAAKELARNVMEFQMDRGKQVADQGLYLATLVRLAKSGRLMIPEGYVAPAERAAKEAAHRKAEVTERKKEAAERAEIEVAEEKFKGMPAEEKERYIGIARVEIGELGSFPGLVQRRAEMLAFQEGNG